VNRDCKIEGILHFRGHLIVEGIIEGTLLAETVFTEKNSNVKAQIRAASLTIAGYLEGEIEVTGTLYAFEISGRERSYQMPQPSH
jgi:cytoskeletal protein CcmA (bactofilin family)